MKTMSEIQLLNKQLQKDFKTNKALVIESKGNTFIVMNDKTYSYASKESRDKDISVIKSYLNKLTNAMFS